MPFAKLHQSLVLLLSIFLLSSFDKHRGVIVPIAISGVVDDTVLQEVQFVRSYLLNKRLPEKSLLNYQKVKRYKRLISLQHRSWEFMVGMGSNVDHFRKSRSEGHVSANISAGTIESIRFRHVKAMLLFDSLSVSKMSAQLTSARAVEGVWQVAAFISRDRLRHYLVMTTGASDPKTLIFIIKDGRLYNCVFDSL